MKIVVNKCYGGFGLSNLASIEYAKRKGLIINAYKQTKYSFKGGVNEYTKIEPTEDYHGMVHFAELVDDVVNDDDLNKNYFSYRNIKRTDSTLIELVEELGDSVNNDYSKLSIVVIPDGIDYEIDDYDGFESIHERHRSW